MITIIAGTNRVDSMTLRTARLYHNMLNSAGIENTLLSLENQDVWEKTAMQQIEKQYLLGADKFIFVLPEYNASFPGVVKMMIDNSDIKKCWWFKKAMLTGISDGRAGNLRGIEHMTSILHYMKMQVHYNKLVLSRINEEIDKEGKILKPETAALMQAQLDEFIKF